MDDDLLLVLLVCVYVHVLACSFAAMASPLLGSVGEFDPSSETFTSYLERLDQLFIANDTDKCAADATAAVVREAGKKKVASMISVNW